MASERAVRPLVPTTIRTEFGEVLEEELLRPDHVGEDFTYVPGYSDLRFARDRALKEVADGKRKAGDVPTLPVRMQWVRTTKNSGAPDTTKPTQRSATGYRVVTKDDVNDVWLKELPAGAVITAGGEIHRGDCVLMMTDAKTAARRAAENQARINQMTKAAAAGELMRAGAAVRGADPTFEVLPGRTIAGPPSAIKG